MTPWSLERHFRRNVMSVALWELLWGFGAACVSAGIVSTFLTQLTGSKGTFGALGLMNLLALPPLFITGYLTRRLRRKRVAACVLWSLQTSTWIVVGAVILLGGSTAPGDLVTLVFVAQAVWFFSNGLTTGPTYEMMAVAFGRRWGTAQGVQIVTNRATGMLGGLFAAAVIQRFSFEQGFGLTFLAGGAFLTVSNLALLLMVEPPAYDWKEPLSPREYLRGMARAVAGDAGFVRLLQVMGLLAFATVGQYFLIVFAIERLGLDVSWAGVFTTISFGASGIGGLVAGRLADAMGYRRLLVGALALHLVSLVAALGSWSVLVFALALACGSIAVAASAIATTTLVASYAPTGEKGGYTAVARLVSQPATAFAGVCAGMLIDRVGFTPTLAAMALFPLAAIALLRATPPPNAADDAG